MTAFVRRKSGIAKVVVVVVLAALVGAAFLLMTQEQTARSSAQQIYDSLSASLDDQLTANDVHEHVGRNPNKTRTPSKHRMVEEYTFKGPFESHTVYAYYSVAATEFLEATSLGQKLDKWESE